MTEWQDPPRIPPELPELRRAIMLLGTCFAARMHVSSKVAEELTQLIGAFPPSRTKAREWKNALKQWARAVEKEPDPEEST